MFLNSAATTMVVGNHIAASCALQAALATCFGFSLRGRPNRPARQCAGKPENNQNDKNQSKDAAKPGSAVTAMSIVAPAAAQQDNHKDNQQNRHHERYFLFELTTKPPSPRSSLDFFSHNIKAREPSGSQTWRS